MPINNKNNHPDKLNYAWIWKLKYKIVWSVFFNKRYLSLDNMVNDVSYNIYVL